MARAIECCISCGRDTRDPSKICPRCLYGQREGGSRDESADGMPLEDDYSEDSGPDSVCNDHHGLDAIAADHPFGRPGKRRRRLGTPL